MGARRVGGGCEREGWRVQWRRRGRLAGGWVTLGGGGGGRRRVGVVWRLLDVV